MPLFPTATKYGLGLVLAASLLAGCKDDAAQPTPKPPVVTTDDPAQYGTPFTGVPDREDAIIYQVNMRAFSQAGNFAGVTARLDSIKALGVNVVYLMPIYPVGTVKAFNSPYAVKNYTAVGAEFGTLADLRTLVDAAHARGLTVMLDWVANHTSWDHAWITAHPDWYKKDGAGNIAAVSNNGQTYTDVAQLDFSSTAMRQEMIKAMRSWVFTANVDGFRYDYADHQAIEFWQQAITSLRGISTHKLLLLAEGGRRENFTANFDYNFGFSFYDALKNAYANGGAANAIDLVNNNSYQGATGTQHVVHYTTNHDVNGSDGTPVAIYRGEAAAMSAFVVATLTKGIPMVYNGQEQGMTTAIPFPFTSVKVRWDGRPDVTRAHRQILKARAGSTALRRGTTTFYSTTDVNAFTKTAGNEQALVLANVRNSTVTFTVPAALNNTTWTNTLDGGSVTMSGQVSLPPYGYMVLKK